MKDYPINLKTNEAIAVEQGVKTQHRILVHPALWRVESVPTHAILSNSPYRRNGRLWVRETFAVFPEYGLVYKAERGLTGPCSKGIRDYADLLGWTPLIQMKRNQARMLLKITNVRLQRFCDMSDNDAKREGFLSREELILYLDSVQSKKGVTPNEYSWWYSITFKKCGC